MTSTDIKIESTDQAGEEAIKEEIFKAEDVAQSKEDIDILKTMIGAGVMYGHKKTKTNPKFSPYIFTNRNGIEIIDISKTIFALEAAAEFLKNLIKENKMILLVATQVAAQEAMENLAKKFDLPYVKKRWLGGLLTNFKSISGRIEYFKKTQEGMKIGEFEKYTKKERVVINKNIERMKQLFGGVENLTRLPDALLVIDTAIKGHLTAIREARRIKIPVVGIIDSDDNPAIVDWPIPANDHAKASIEWTINKIIEKIQ